ncbi:hypothetical protein PAAL66ix_27978 [Paenibacillus alvei A6-6i-x]|nr:hypothetical protein PAAL66ix_27978 [Paenibacillus alvei A6-6i-x]
MGKSNVFTPTGPIYVMMDVIRQQDKRERGNDMYVVCKEHVELAIDNFVDEFEDAPDVVDLDGVEFSDWERPIKCCMDCEQEAKFLVV